MQYLNDNLRQKKALENRTKRFAVAVFKYLDRLPLSISCKTIGFQIGKSASSIGANYREANRAESREDFVHKIGIVLKECSETVYWLEVLGELREHESAVEDLLAEAGELLRLFQCSSRTLRTNRKIEKSQITQSIEKSINRKIEKSPISPIQSQIPQSNRKID